MEAKLTMTERILPHIYLDEEAYYDFDNDKIVYGIAATEQLVEYADIVRHFLGFKPFFYDLGFGRDDDGYYDFYIIAGKKEVLNFYFVVSCDGADDWHEYDIPLPEPFKSELYNRLNELSTERCGGTVRELIELNETEE